MTGRAASGRRSLLTAKLFQEVGQVAALAHIEHALDLMADGRAGIGRYHMRFVYLGFPTEFDVIVGRSSSAIGESRQTLRRCLQPICDEFRDGVTALDVETYLAGVGFNRNAELRNVAAEIQPFIASRYNLTTLASAVRDARKQADDEDTKLTLGMVTGALQALCSTAASRRAMLAQMNGGAK